MVVQLKLDFGSSQEQKYMRTHLGYMSSSKSITILGEYFLKFLQMASSENEEELTKQEKKGLVTKLIDTIIQKENKEAFLNLIIPSISTLHKVVSNPILEETSDNEKLIDRTVEILKEDGSEREKFIESIWDLVPLNCLQANHTEKLLQALIDSGDLNRLLENNDDLCKVGELLPQLSFLIIRSVLADKNLRKKLVVSSQELAKTQQYFPFLVSKKQTITLSPSTAQSTVSHAQQNKERKSPNFYRI